MWTFYTKCSQRNNKSFLPSSSFMLWAFRRCGPDWSIRYSDLKWPGFRVGLLTSNILYLWLVVWPQMIYIWGASSHLRWCRFMVGLPSLMIQSRRVQVYTATWVLINPGYCEVDKQNQTPDIILEPWKTKNIFIKLLRLLWKTVVIHMMEWHRDMPKRAMQQSNSGKLWIFGLVYVCFNKALLEHSSVLSPIYCLWLFFPQQQSLGIARVKSIHHHSIDIIFVIPGFQAWRR